MMISVSGMKRRIQYSGLAVLSAAVLAIPGAYAEQKPAAAVRTARDEIKAFCANIADAARDQRYLLQKEELTRLQADVDERIALLEKRKIEYEDWLKKRNDFLKRADEGLISIYKTMKPDAAAEQLQLVDPNIASAIIMKLAPRQSALILAEMEEDKAATLTSIISAAVNRKPSRKNPT